MRSRFDEQLALLNKEMIEMGALCEEVIALASKALTEADPELAQRVAPLDAEIDQKERNIESLCLKLLLQQQPVARDLRQISAARSVTVSVTGQPAVLPGVRRLIYEIVYNLCDNAIKYNRDGGRVDVTVAADAGGSSITVADTGIGIAPEHQARVFERFYRVDKSHSKASGGTGLGLSIVKHAVQYHHGRIELESTPGTGTTIRVVFPNP